MFKTPETMIFKYLHPKNTLSFKGITIKNANYTPIKEFLMEKKSCPDFC